MSSTRIKVVLQDDRAYDIRIGSGLVDQLGNDLRALSAAKKVVLITDSNVGPLYLAQVRQRLQEAGFEVFDLSIPAGEASKCIEVATEIWEALSMLGLGRDDLLVALGGGVVGDMVGFVASTYMRGISFAQLPTTLLAMVDSSVGGKTAINLANGKNLVGSFYQPIYVMADLDFLHTLPKLEFANGFAEIAKMAIISGGEFFAWLDANTSVLAAYDVQALQQAIVYSLSFKASVVVADERESGQRECLNFGHTFGHALESVSDYAISHGQAVAEGMRFAAVLAREVIGAKPEFASRVDNLLNKLGLSTIEAAFSSDELYKRLFADKKTRQNELRFVLAQNEGQWRSVVVDWDLAKIHLIYWEQARLQ